MKRYMIIAFILLSSLCLFLANRNQHLRRDVARQENNIVALSSDLEKMTDDYGNSVARCQALELSNNEIERLYSEQADLVKALNLKVQRLQTLVNTTTVIRDSIFIPVQSPVITDSASVIHPLFYDDRWMTLNGMIIERGDSMALALDYTVRDTVDVYVYRVPRKFLFIRWGTKRYDCYVRNRNPHADVTNASCVVSTRKK